LSMRTTFVFCIILFYKNIRCYAVLTMLFLIIIKKKIV
jgi:hypothetical protein